MTDLSHLFPQDQGWTPGITAHPASGWREDTTIVRAAVALNGIPLVVTLRQHNEVLRRPEVSIAVLDQMRHAIAAEIAKRLEAVIMSCPAARFDGSHLPGSTDLTLGPDLSASYGLKAKRTPEDS